MDPAPCKSDFLAVNGIRLHYLDWGGNGSLHDRGLVFIPGKDCSPYIFGRFAPRFTDRFRVIGFSRRGHGDSDYPETGYDADTLTEDLRQFLDALGVERVILAGHSMAYIELTRFAALYPERVSKLIFMDAHDLNDPERKAIMARNPLRGLVPPWPEENPATIEEFAAAQIRLYPFAAAVWGEAMEANLRHSVKPAPEGGWVEKMTGGIDQALNETMATYDPRYADIQAPLLRIFAIADGTDFLSQEYMTEEQRARGLEFFRNELTPYYTRFVEQFRRSVPQARVVVIPRGHHMCFIKNEEAVYAAMREFLEE